MKPRSQKIILTSEAQVLKALRSEHKLSMKKVAKLIGVSDSTIAHIETGRMNPPQGKRLEELLGVYGGIKEKSFYERVRCFKAATTPKEDLLKLIQRANDGQVQTLLTIATGLLT